MNDSLLMVGGYTVGGHYSNLPDWLEMIWDYEVTHYQHYQPSKKYLKGLHFRSWTLFTWVTWVLVVEPCWTKQLWNLGSHFSTDRRDSPGDLVCANWGYRGVRCLCSSDANPGWAIESRVWAYPSQRISAPFEVILQSFYTLMKTIVFFSRFFRDVLSIYSGYLLSNGTSASMSGLSRLCTRWRGDLHRWRSYARAEDGIPGVDYPVICAKNIEQINVFDR